MFPAIPHSTKSLACLLLGLFCMNGFGVTCQSQLSRNYERLLQPTEHHQVVAGAILKNEKIKRVIVLFPTFQHKITYEYELAGSVFSESYTCRKMAQCYFLKEGSADIFVHTSGVSIPMNLRNGLPTRLKRSKFRANLAKTMTVIVGLALAIILAWNSLLVRIASKTNA